MQPNRKNTFALVASALLNANSGAFARQPVSSAPIVAADAGVKEPSWFSRAYKIALRYRTEVEKYFNIFHDVYEKTGIVQDFLDAVEKIENVPAGQAITWPQDLIDQLELEARNYQRHANVLKAPRLGDPLDVIKDNALANPDLAVRQAAFKKIKVRFADFEKKIQVFERERRAAAVVYERSALLTASLDDATEKLTKINNSPVGAYLNAWTGSHYVHLLIEASAMGPMGNAVSEHLNAANRLKRTYNNQAARMFQDWDAYENVRAWTGYVEKMDDWRRKNPVEKTAEDEFDRNMEEIRRRQEEARRNGEDASKIVLPSREAREIDRLIKEGFDRADAARAQAEGLLKEDASTARKWNGGRCKVSSV